MYRVGLPLWKLFAKLGITVFCRVNVIHDPEAGVYVATSPDLKGLVVEADSIQALFFETQDCISMLLEELLQSDSKAEVRTLWDNSVHATA